MSRSLKYEIPGEDWRCTAVDLCELGYEGLFASELPADFERVLELGFGRGEFMLELAAARPDTAFLGVEISFKRVLKMARKVAARGLRNVRLLEARGQVVVKDLLAQESVNEVWVNFSDPWPKDRHAGRRLIQPALISDVARILVPGGLLHTATDDVPYARQIHQVLSSEPRLVNCNSPAKWLSEVPGRMPTGYETDWREAGRPLHFFTHRCTALTDSP